HRFGLCFDSVDPVGDEVADRDDSREAPILDHGQMADPALGHLGQSDERLHLGLDGDRGRGHHLSDWPIENRGPFPSQAMDDVAFGENSGDLAAFDHDDGADMAFGKGGHRLADGGVGADARDIAALALEDRGYGHRASPGFDSAFSFSAGGFQWGGLMIAPAAA